VLAMTDDGTTFAAENIFAYALGSGADTVDISIFGVTPSAPWELSIVDATPPLIPDSSELWVRLEKSPPSTGLAMVTAVKVAASFPITPEQTVVFVQGVDGDPRVPIHRLA
jgi:hypothetical protein